MKLYAETQIEENVMIRVDEADLEPYEFSDINGGDLVAFGSSNYYEVVDKFQDGHGNLLLICKKPFVVFDDTDI